MKTKGLLDYFNRLIGLLDNHPLFNDISLEGRLMKEEDKSSYWSTLYFKGVRENHHRKLGHATISINLRDINTKKKVREAVAHEAGSLISTPDDILALIKKLEKESDMNNSTYVMIDDTEHADWIKYLPKMRGN